MRVAIIGYGVEGQQSAQYWHQTGHDITIADKNADIQPDNPSYHLKLGENYLKDLNQFDLLVRTPGLHPREILDANPEHPQIKDKITTNINEFFARCPSRNIIGITGTKGKGTTSTLIAKMLESAGKTAYLAGNIGTPPLDLLPKIKSTDWVVLELGAFQIMDIKYSPQVALCLMITAEHLDYYNSEQEYREAKKQLFRWQTENDLAVYNGLSEGSVEIIKASPARKLAYEVPPEGKEALHKEGGHVNRDMICFDGYAVCKVEEVKLLGRHNLENICAAITAIWEATKQDVPAIKEVIKTFAGLEHRIEFVREIDGVKYYNDSFATTPETTIACLRAFPDKPKVIILGGADKGLKFDSLADEILKSKVQAVVIVNNQNYQDQFGNTGPTIEKLLRDRGFSNIISGLTDMKSIVEAAKKAAQSKGVVLLSTACASFGAFHDYKDRGNQFKEAVQKLV